AIVGAGDVLVYALEVANFGNQDATGVLLTENVPAHTTFAAAQSEAAWTCAGISAGSSCSLAVGDLAAGATRSFAYAVRVDAPVAAGVNELVNSAAVAGAGVDLDPTNNTATEVTPLDGGVGGTGPNLAVTKSDGGAVASAGDTVVYSLAVENLGNQDASGVELTETVPSHTTFVASASAPGWGCSGVTPGSVCVLSLGSLPVGAPAQAASFAVRVDDPLATGVTELVNTVLATDDGSGGGEQDPSDNSATEVTPLDVGTGGPDLVITKSD
ncbi:MAG: DUF11 domain-containing protein, partial [Ketobacter sp.]|nr:DUF11 domain-containing protein [Ketobacter sp.]